MYLLQMITSDYGIQLRTEVTADTVKELRSKAADMVKRNPIVQGMTYGIWEVTKDSTGRFVSKLVKKDVVSS